MAGPVSKPGTGAGAGALNNSAAAGGGASDSGDAGERAGAGSGDEVKKPAAEGGVSPLLASLPSSAPKKPEALAGGIAVWVSSTGSVVKVAALVGPVRELSPTPPLNSVAAEGGMLVPVPVGVPVLGITSPLATFRRCNFFSVGSEAGAVAVAVAVAAVGESEALLKNPAADGTLGSDIGAGC